MSTYTTSITRIDPTVLRREAIARVLGRSIDGWLSSARLDALLQVQGLAQGQQFVCTAGSGPAPRLAALAASPALLTVVDSVAATEYREAVSLADQAVLALSGSDARLSKEFERAADLRLTTALQTTLDRVRSDERRIVAATTIGVLQGLGYEVDAEQGDSVTGIWATRGHEMLAAVVRDGGSIVSDWAGCAGDACHDPMAEFLDGLEHDGIATRTANTQSHGDERGGALITRASQATGGRGMAHGLVAQEHSARRTDQRDRVASRANNRVRAPQ